MKKMISLTALLFVAGTLISCGNNKKSELTILYTNDVHCALNKYIGYDGLSAYKKELENQGKEVILVDCGDHIQGGTSGFLSDGQYPMDVINKVGYDVAIPGNHEFDYTVKTFLDLASKASFPYISSNFIHKEDNKTVFDAFKIVEKGGYKIGFVGITTPEAMTVASPSKFKDDKGNIPYTFLEGKTGDALYQNVQNSVNEVKNKGVDFVVALAHLGEQNDIFSSDKIINNTNGIDLLLDGHSHSVVESHIAKNKDGKDVPVSQTGTGLVNIGQATITKEGTITTKLINDYKNKDKNITDAINEVDAKIKPITSKKIGHTNYLLSIEDENKQRIVRKTSTNLSDLYCDALKNIGEAQIGLVNGGGIRINIQPGDITFDDAINVSPFGNMLAVIKATGAMIKNYVEFGAKNSPKEGGGFALPSEGLTWTIDTSQPAGSRIKNLKLNNVDIDMNATYTVAGTEYNLISGPDAPTLFPNCEKVSCRNLVDCKVFAEYIETNLKGEIPERYSQIRGENRITVI